MPRYVQGAPSATPMTGITTVIPAFPFTPYTCDGLRMTFAPIG